MIQWDKNDIKLGAKGKRQKKIITPIATDFSIHFCSSVNGFLKTSAYFLYNNI